MIMDNIRLTLSINETNAVLLALAKMPYESVAQLIDKIRAQSLPQVPEDQRNVTGRDRLRQDLEDLVTSEGGDLD
jgi:hypothetical protein